MLCYIMKPSQRSGYLNEFGHVDCVSNIFFSKLGVKDYTLTGALPPSVWIDDLYTDAE